LNAFNLFKLCKFNLQRAFCRTLRKQSQEKFKGFASLRKQQLNYSSIYLCASQSQGKHAPIDFMIQRGDRSQSRFYICMNRIRTKQF